MNGLFDEDASLTYIRRRYQMYTLYQSVYYLSVTECDQSFKNKLIHLVLWRRHWNAAPLAKP